MEELIKDMMQKATAIVITYGSDITDIQMGINDGKFKSRYLSIWTKGNCIADVYRWDSITKSFVLGR